MTKEERVKEAYLAELREFAIEFHRVPTMWEFLAGRGGFDIFKALDLFGTWDDFVRAAGMKPRRGKHPITSAELTTEARKLARELGRSPSTKDYNRCDYTHHSTTVFKYFKTWDKFLEAANLPPYEKSPHRGRRIIPNEKYISDIKHVAKLIGHPPKTEEYGRFGKYSVPSIISRFGSWKKSLEAAGLRAKKTTAYERYDESIQQFLKVQNARI